MGSKPSSAKTISESRMQQNEQEKTLLNTTDNTSNDDIDDDNEPIWKTDVMSSSSSFEVKTSGRIEDDEVVKLADENIALLKKCWAILTDGTGLKDGNGKYKQYVSRALVYTMNLQVDHGDFTSVQCSMYSKRISSYLLQSGIIKFVCDYVVDIFKHPYFSGDQKNIAEDILSGVTIATGILVNFTDESNEQSFVIRDHSSYLPLTATQLQKWYKFAIEGKQTSADEEIIQSSMNIIFNMTMNRDNVDRFNSLGFKEILIPFLNISEDSDLRLTSLAALANLVDEKESHVLRTDNTVLTFLIETIESALKSEDHREFGWSALELAKVVRRIAKNDNNKRILVELGVLRPLTAMAENDEVEEQREAVKSMWTLSFDEENVKMMVTDTSCKVVDIFVKLKTSSSDDKVRNTCTRALWTMREKLAQSERYKEIGQQLIGSQKPNSSLTGTKKSHVMISYQWSNQSVLKRVRDEIKKHNFQVWMDIDDMEGSTIGAMAAAVEEASVVLICSSKRYKDSDSCRLEAEYALKLKKPIIPLIMERGYQADGWLGIIIGTKLFFDFSGKYEFDPKMDGLLKALYKTLNERTSDRPDVIKPVAVPTLAAAPTASLIHQERHVYAEKPMSVSKSGHTDSIRDIKAWSTDDVTKWLTKHNLPRKKFKTLTGVDVAFLLVLKQQVSGDFFFKTLLELLKITDMSTLSKLHFALEDTSLT